MFPELDQKYVDMVPKLFTAVLCDVMDAMGYWEQAMSYEIKPLRDDMRVFGRALTVLAVDIYRKPKESYKLEIEAVDALKPGDVMVTTTNGSRRSCFWGELLSTAAQFKGATGVVVDGLTRDVRGILKLNFPVFVAGSTPADSLGRIDVIDFNVPIVCGGVKVNPGDYIFGDLDGVCVIPKEILPEVFERAIEKAEAERDVRKVLESGMSVGDMFKKFGIL
jgi:regulator of RNase E activity RraA